MCFAFLLPSLALIYPLPDYQKRSDILSAVKAVPEQKHKKPENFPVFPGNYPVIRHEAPQRTKTKKASNDGSDVGVPLLDLSHCVELNCPEPHARTFFFLSSCTELNKKEAGVGMLPAPVYFFIHMNTAF